MTKKMKSRLGTDGYSYPYTHEDLIFNDEGTSLSQKLENLATKAEIPSIEGLATEELVNSLNNDVVEDINEINTELETKASTEFVNDMLSGLRLMQITQSEYDALEVKDSNTLYIII